MRLGFYMSAQLPLFRNVEHLQVLRPGVTFLPDFFISTTIWSVVQTVLEQAPLRHLITPNGQQMSVSMSNCGHYGWVSDKTEYRYSELDPLSGKAWPQLPAVLHTLAQQAAQQGGFEHFNPNACLINCYHPGARMGLHQDKDEADALSEHAQPIVSLSLGLPAKFLLGGITRSDKTQSLLLQDGDALVFVGPARLMFHGVRPLTAATHALLGEQRINLTFRRAR